VIANGKEKKTYNLQKLSEPRARDFSHEFTSPLKGQKLNNWAIMYSNYGKREYQTLVKELQGTVKNDF